MNNRTVFPFLFTLLNWCLPAPAASAAHVNVIELDNRIISPVTHQYIIDAIERSETDGAVCLIIQLDTPGGLLQSTRSIVKRMMNASVPIVVYVAPSGSRAGSAGLFITLAANVAAMAPSTNIGAAHPVLVGDGSSPMKRVLRNVRGTDDESDQQTDKKPNKADDGSKNTEPQKETSSDSIDEATSDPMMDKVLNDTLAWVSSIARARGRNEEWSKKAVTESFSVTEQEALTLKIIDLIAPDIPDLLKQLNGRTVQLKEGGVQLATESASVSTIPMSKRQEFLAIITDPNIAYLLMLLGTLGLIFEFTHPGFGFPGIGGLICLLLALYAFQALPISYAALGLLLLGVILLIVEIKVISYGLLTIGGVISLTLGSLLLFESGDSGLRVSLHVIIPTIATLAGFVLFLGARALRAQKRPIATGPQGLLGEIGIAAAKLDLKGKVFIHGEWWDATSTRPIQQGERFRVIKVEGLQLLVDRVESSSSNPARPRSKRS